MTNDVRFFAEDFDTICSRPGQWLVKGLWPRVGVCFVAGPSMAGKSFLSLDLASSVARGDPVFSNRSVRSGVVYIAAEGANGMRTRIEGLRVEGGGWESYMHLISDAPDLGQPNDIESLRQALHGARNVLNQNGVRLGLVVVDTLSASIPGADENSAKDMSPILADLQLLAKKFEVCVLVVAHVGKDAERGIRGWSGILANADGYVSVGLPDDDGVRVATVVKVKDGEAGTKFAFSLEKVLLGKDLDGDPITTCTVMWRDLPEKATRRKLTVSGKLILRTLTRLMDHGVGVPVVAPGAPAGTFGIPGKLLASAAFDDGLGGPEPDESERRKRWKDAQRKRYENGISSLQDAGEIRSENKVVWRVQQPITRP